MRKELKSYREKAFYLHENETIYTTYVLTLCNLLPQDTVYLKNLIGFFKMKIQPLYR